MPLFNFGLHKPYSEDEMQFGVAEYIKSSNKFVNSNFDRIKPDVIREFRIPEIGRRSDIVVFFSKRKIFNIECKLDDVGGVLAQAKDHLKWANYSIICLPHNTYVPPRYQAMMIEKGIGLLLWIPEYGVIEVINAFHNHPEDKDMRKIIVNRLIDKIEPPQKTMF